MSEKECSNCQKRSTCRSYIALRHYNSTVCGEYIPSEGRDKKIFVHDDEPAIVIYSRIINELPDVGTIRKFCTEIRNSYKTERDILIEVGKQFINIDRVH